MGNFISKLKSEIQRIDLINCSNLRNLTLMQISEYLANFKMISETFSINFTEFEQIFSNINFAKEFYLWDTDNNGLIDSLELFNGLILFSDSSSEEKVKFLFDLFDFNEISSIGYYDFCFLLEALISSSLKIHKLALPIPSDEIEEMIGKFIIPTMRIKLIEMKRILSEYSEVKNFLQIFKLDTLGVSNMKIKPEEGFKLNADLYQFYKNQLLISDSKYLTQLEFNPNYLFDNKRFEGYRNWISQAVKKLTHSRLTDKNFSKFYQDRDIIDYKIKLNWVYGIRISECKKPIQYLKKNYSKINGKNFDRLVLIYSVGKVIIILYTHYQKQEYYINHENEVISLTISHTNKNLCASGEICPRPSIHIWQGDNMKTLSILKGHHENGVILLTFTNDDKFLISCSLKSQSSILIHDWEKNLIIHSFNINSTVQDLDVNYIESAVKSNGFYGNLFNKIIKNNMSHNKEVHSNDLNQDICVICCEFEIVVIKLMNNSIKTLTVPLKKNEIKSEILSVCVVKNYHDENPEKSFINTLETVGVVFLTGHMDGSVNIWDEKGFKKKFIKYKSEIISITQSILGIIIALSSSQIYIWNNNLNILLHELDLNDCGLKFLSTIIKSIDTQKEKLLIATIAGDVIEVKIAELNTQYHRIDQITKIESPVNCLTISDQNEGQVIYGSEMGFISVIDSNKNEINDIVSIGHKITAMDCITDENGFYLAIGCDNGNLFIRKNWDNFPIKYDIFGNKTLTEIKFMNTHEVMIVCSLDKSVYLVNFRSDEPHKDKLILLEGCYAISVNFNDNYSSLLITTNQWKFILINLHNFEISNLIDEISNSLWLNFEGKYPINTKIYSNMVNSVTIGNRSNFVIASDELNNFHFWKNQNEIAKNTSQIIRVHSSHIQKVKLSYDDKFLFTIGYNDGMICKWKIKELLNDVTAKRNEFREKLLNIDEVFIDNVYLISELNYSLNNVIENGSENSNLDEGNVLVKGFTSKISNLIFDKKLSEIEYENLSIPPQVCMNLNHIFGSHICEKRNSVFYLHRFKNKYQDKYLLEKELNHLSDLSRNPNLNNIRKISLEEKSVNSNTFEDFLKFVTISDNKRYKHHNHCKRNFVYFNSRFVILYDNIKKKQDVYQTHPYKVSAISIHPFKKLIASGEVSDKPKIHIWKYESFETLNIFDTGHSNGILHLAFSHKGRFLLSIAFDLCFSLQIFLLNNNNSMTQNFSPIFKNTGTYPIYFAKFFYSTEEKFLTCGYRHITIWKINGNILEKEKHIESEECLISNENEKHLEFKIFLCADFLDFSMSNTGEINTDILIGSNLGDISSISCGRYLILKHNAHKGAINCLKITDLLLHNKYALITAGEDGLIKIWDQTVRNLQVIDPMQMKNINIGLKSKHHRGIQSIDLFGCEKSSVFVLLGLRSGDLFEFEIKDREREALFIQETSSSKNGSRKESLERAILHKNSSHSNPNSHGHNQMFSLNQIYSYPYCITLTSKLNNIIHTVHPTLPIIVTFSEDQTIRFYDYERKEVILMQDLGFTATCASFSPDGNIIAIGLLNGSVLILNSVISMNLGMSNQGNTHGKYVINKFEPEIIQNATTPVILVKFSNQVDFLAVSYDNKKSKEGKSQQGGGFVSIYIMKLSKKLSSINLKRRMSNNTNNNFKNLYTKLVDITIPISIYEMTNLNHNESAATHVEFSEDSMYLLISCQKVGDNLRKIHSKESIFLIFDIKSNQMSVSSEVMKNLKFSSPTVANAISAYHLKKDEHDSEIVDSLEEICLFTASNQIQSKGIMIAGNMKGNLFAFRSIYLFIEQNKNLMKTTSKKEIKNNLQSTNIDKTGICRIFSGHAGEIARIDVTSLDKILFTSSISEQCIIQWRLEIEDLFSDLDYFPIQSYQDPFKDILNKEYFTLLTEEFWANRQSLIEIYNNVTDENNSIEFELLNIFGRKSVDMRNNLKYDSNNKMIYNISSYIVRIHRDVENFLVQDFLIAEENLNSKIQSEISCFCISDDKQDIGIGTCGAYSTISVWHLNTKTNLVKITINECSVISMLKFSYNKSSIVGVGINKNYFPIVFLINTMTCQIIAMNHMIQTLPFKIKDVEFMTKKSDEFITVGIQHLAIWSLKGINLEFRNIALKINKLTQFYEENEGYDKTNQAEENLDESIYGVYLIEEKQKIESIAKYNGVVVKNELKVTFLNIAMVNQNAVLGGDDGNLYIFDIIQLEIIDKIHSHNGPITALSKNLDTLYLVSGSLDGKIILFKIDLDTKEKIRNLQVSKMFKTYIEELSLKQILINPEYNVQSVSLGINKIAVGTRNGNILEFIISEDLKIIDPESGGKPSQINFLDNYPPVSMAIDNESIKIFMISANGLFTVWDIQNFKFIYTNDYQMNSVYLYHFKFQNKLLIAFEYNIIVIETSNPEKLYSAIPKFDLETGKINDVKISPNEKFLAVASISNSIPVLYIYDILEGFTPKNIIQNFNTTIKFVDFSLDSNFILIEDSLDEVIVIDIYYKREVNINDLNYDSEWTNEALKYSGKLKCIHNDYDNKMNSISKIVRYPLGNFVAVGDELGTVKFFKYPCDEEDDSYFACKTDHTGKITNLLFSTDLKYLLTSSEYDRAVFIYRVDLNK